MANKHKRQNHSVKKTDVEAAKAVAAQNTAANAAAEEVRNDDVIVLPAEDVKVVEETVETPVAEENVTEEVPAEETVAEEVPAEETVAEEVPTEETVAEEVPAEETVAEEVPAEETVAEEVPAEEIVAEEVPAEETVAEEVPAEETVAEEVPAEEPEPAKEGLDDDDIAEVMAIVNKRKQPVAAPVEESVEEAPVEETSAEEVPAEETVEEVPGEEPAALSKQEDEKKEDSEKKIPLIAKVFGGIATCFLGVIAVALIIMLCRGGNSPSVSTDTTLGTLPPETTVQQPEETTVPTQQPEKEAFDIKNFEEKVINMTIFNGVDEEKAISRVSTLATRYGAEMLEKTTKTHGGQKTADIMSAIAAFVPDIIAEQKAAANGIAAMTTTDFFAKLSESDAKYQETFGQDPDDVLRDLIKINNGDGGNPQKIREVAKATLAGDELEAFLEWYSFRNEGFGQANIYDTYIEDAEDMLLYSTTSAEFFELIMGQVEEPVDFEGKPTVAFKNAVVKNSRLLASGYRAN